MKFQNTHPIEGPGYRITENIADFSGSPHLHDGDHALWVQITDWLTFHGFDVSRVTVDTTIVRGPFWCAATCVVTDDNDRIAVCHDENGHAYFSEYSRIEYNEGPPLPFPGFGFEDARQRFNF